MIVAASYVLIVNCRNPKCSASRRVAFCQTWGDSARALRTDGWFVHRKQGAVCPLCRKHRAWRRNYLPPPASGAAPPRPPLPLKAGVSAASRAESKNR